MIGFRFLPQAEEELVEAALFYEALDDGLGDDFLDEVQIVIDSFRENPLAGAPICNELRRGLFPKFPYSIIYAIEPACILIAAIAHQRRFPGYWLGRLDP